MKKNSVLKNTTWVVLCKIAQSLLSLTVNMLTARYLGPSNYGIISYAASIVAFVAPLMKLGYNHIAVNEMINQPDKEGEIVGTSLFFNSLSAVACIIGLAGVVYISNPNEPVTLIVCILYSVTLLAQALEMIVYWFQAKLISQYTSLTGLAAYIIVSAYKIYLLITQKNVYWFALSNALDYFVIAVVLIFFYYRLSNQKLTVSFKRFTAMFSKSKYFIISSMMVTIFAQTDKIMLKHMLGEHQVGIYSAAVTCAGVTGFVFAAIIDSFRPVIFENKNSQAEKYKKSIINCYSVVVYFSLIQCIFFTLFSKIIINILYGSDYSEAVNVLKLVVWYSTFSYIGSIRNIWILAESKQKFLWIINLSGALTNVVLNLILIPIWGTMGAALASFLTQIFTNVIISFIISPIRYNNYLLFKSLDPRPMLQYIRSFLVLKK